MSEDLRNFNLMCRLANERDELRRERDRLRAENEKFRSALSYLRNLANSHVGDLGTFAETIVDEANEALHKGEGDGN